MNIICYWPTVEFVYNAWYCNCNISTVIKFTGHGWMQLQIININKKHHLTAKPGFVHGLFSCQDPGNFKRVYNMYVLISCGPNTCNNSISATFTIKNLSGRWHRASD